MNYPNVALSRQDIVTALPTTQDNTQRQNQHGSKKLGIIKTIDEDNSSSKQHQFVERRSGVDRRHTDLINNKRLDSRCAKDRRAPRLFIQI